MPRDFVKLCRLEAPGIQQIGDLRYLLISGRLALDLLKQPHPTKSPGTLDGAKRDAQCLGDLRMSQTGKKAQFDNLRTHWVELFEIAQCFVHRQQFIGRQATNQLDLIHVHALKTTAVPEPVLAPGVLNQDPAHGFGCGRKEMSASLPL